MAEPMLEVPQFGIFQSQGELIFSWDLLIFKA